MVISIQRNSVYFSAPIFTALARERAFLTERPAARRLVDRSVEIDMSEVLPVVVGSTFDHWSGGDADAPEPLVTAGFVSTIMIALIAFAGYWAVR